MNSTVNTRTDSDIYMLEAHANPYSIGRPRTIWVIERRKTFVFDGVTGRALSASLDLCYSRVEHGEMHERGHIEVHYVDTDGWGCISFCAAPQGERNTAVGAHAPRHEQIRTYIFNAAIKWAKEWPRARVQPIVLADKTEDHIETISLASFLRQFNLPVVDIAAHGPYRPASCGDLIFAPMAVGGIHLSEFDIGSAFRNVQSQLHAVERDLILKEIRLETFRSQLEKIESRPCRWMIARLGWALWNRIACARAITSRLIAAVRPRRDRNKVSGSVLDASIRRDLSAQTASED